MVHSTIHTDTHHSEPVELQELKTDDGHSFLVLRLSETSLFLSHDTARLIYLALHIRREHSGRSLEDALEAYRVECLSTHPGVAHTLGLLLETCE